MGYFACHVNLLVKGDLYFARTTHLILNLTYTESGRDPKSLSRRPKSSWTTAGRFPVPVIHCFLLTSIVLLIPYGLTPITSKGQYYRGLSLVVLMLTIVS